MFHKNGKTLLFIFFLIFVSVLLTGCNSCVFCFDGKSDYYSYSYSFEAFLDYNGNGIMDDSETVYGDFRIEVTQGNRKIKTIQIQDGRGSYFHHGSSHPPSSSDFNVFPPKGITFTGWSGWDKHISFSEYCCGLEESASVTVKIPLVQFSDWKAPTPTRTPTPTPTSTPKPTRTPLPTFTPAPCLALISPEDGHQLDEIGQVTFRWAKKPGADAYLLIITQPNWEMVMHRTVGPSKTIWLESISMGGNYNWKVLAYGSTGEAMCTSHEYTFSKPLHIPEVGPWGGTKPKATCPPFYQDGDNCYYTPEP